MDIQSLGVSGVGVFTGMFEVWYGTIVELPTSEGLFILSAVVIGMSVKFRGVEMVSILGRTADSIIVRGVGALT